MKKKLIGCFSLICLFWIEASAQETFKVMFYNLLNYPLEDAVPNREDDLEFILSDYQPDLFLVCELNNVTGANNVLNITRSAIGRIGQTQAFRRPAREVTLIHASPSKRQMPPHVETQRFPCSSNLVSQTSLSVSHSFSVMYSMR